MAIALATAAPARSPIAIRPGTDQTAPSGVQPSTPTAAVKTASRSPPPVDAPTIAAIARGEIRASTTRAAMPMRRAPRPRRTAPTTDVVRRDPATQVAAPTSPATIATTAETGCIHQAIAAPSEIEDRDDPRHPGDADQEHRAHQLPGAHREARELHRVEGLLDAFEQQRHDDPAEHERRAADHDDRLRRRGRGGGGDRQPDQREAAAGTRPCSPPMITATSWNVLRRERVGQHPESQP